MEFPVVFCSFLEKFPIPRQGGEKDSMRFKKWLLTIGLTLFLIGPLAVQRLWFPERWEIGAVHGLVSQLAAVVSSLWLLKRPAAEGLRGIAVTLASAFADLFASDTAFSLIFLSPLRGQASWEILIDLGYSVFLGGFLSALFLMSPRKMRDFPSLLLILVVSSCYLLVAYETFLAVQLESGGGTLKWGISVLTVLLEAAIAGFGTLLLFRRNDVWGSAFAFLAVFVSVTLLGTNFQNAVLSMEGKAAFYESWWSSPLKFEQLWQMSCASIAVLLAFPGRRSFLAPELLAPLGSLRFTVAGGLAAGTGAFAGMLWLLGIIHLGTGLAPAHVAIALALTLAAASGLGLWVSRFAMRTSRILMETSLRELPLIQLPGVQPRLAEEAEARSFSEIEEASCRYEVLARHTEQLLRDHIEQRRAAAVGSLVQMLAHDVRKPFSLLQMSVSLIESATSWEALKALLPEIRAGLSRSTVQVEGLLEDVLEMGRKVEPVKRPEAPENLLSDALHDAVRLYPDATIELETRLRHKHEVLVEARKVHRVIGNILVNAIQAMRRSGRLRVETEELRVGGERRVLIRIGNDGPPIPSEQLPRLFEMFYTSGKAGGTGLGLAIAKKVVEAHGGTIRCESPGRTFPVEFSFDLPAAESEVRGAGSLPQPWGERK